MSVTGIHLEINELQAFKSDMMQKSVSYTSIASVKYTEAGKFLPILHSACTSC
jgi:hypothetical protein